MAPLFSEKLNISSTPDNTKNLAYPMVEEAAERPPDQIPEIPERARKIFHPELDPNNQAEAKVIEHINKLMCEIGEVAKRFDILKREKETDESAKEMSALCERITTLTDLIDKSQREKRVIKEETDEQKERPEKSEFPPLKLFEETIAAIEKAENVKVAELDDWRSYEEVKGLLNGRVKIGGRWLPVIDGELWKEMDGMEIEDCGDIRNIEGQLNGWVTLRDNKRPVIDGQIITTIKDEIGQEIKIEACGDIHNINHQLNGSVWVNGLLLPVVDGRLLTKVKDETNKIYKIESCDDIQNINGKLNGRIWISRERVLPVINGQLLRTVRDEKNKTHEIITCVDVQNIGGQLNGFVEISRKGILTDLRDAAFGINIHLPVVNGRLIKKIDGQKFSNFFQPRIIEGRINGTIITRAIISDHFFPVIEGKMPESENPQPAQP